MSVTELDAPSESEQPRGACPITATVNGRNVTLDGVPPGAAYRIGGDGAGSGVVTDGGALSLAFAGRGTYTITIPCAPLLDYAGSFTLA